MNTFSHILLGKLLCGYLNAHHGVKLSRKSFLYGCVMPDFTPAFRRQPHEPEYWTDYIRDELGLLSGHRQAHRRFGHDYSMRLGILCHLYADFFCLAHTPAFEGGSVEHLRYEWALHGFARSHAPELYRAAFGGYVPGGSVSAAADAVKGLHGQYRAGQPSFERDAVYTLRACAEAAVRVTEASIAEEGAVLPLPAFGAGR